MKKIMIYTSLEGIYLFLYDTINDSSSIKDYFFDTLEEAEEFIDEEFSEELDWIIIDEPMVDCQQDIISPVRIKGRNVQNPQWGKFEKLVDGIWIDYQF
jgi:biofilm protein TabA